MSKQGNFYPRRLDNEFRSMSSGAVGVRRHPAQGCFHFDLERDGARTQNLSSHTKTTPLPATTTTLPRAQSKPPIPVTGAEYDQTVTVWSTANYPLLTPGIRRHRPGVG